MGDQFIDGQVLVTCLNRKIPLDRHDVLTTVGQLQQNPFNFDCQRSAHDTEWS
jgi:hypothetical protein